MTHTADLDDVDGSDAIVIERVLRAPIDLVWAMWTEAEHFAAWYGPRAASVPHIDFDLRVGGRRQLCMRMDTPHGPSEMWFTGQFRVLDAPHRLVYTETMTDAEGTTMSPADMGLPDDTVMTTEVCVELERAGHGTRILLTHSGVPAGSPAEAGWTMAIDKLERHLARQ